MEDYGFWLENLHTEDQAFWNKVITEKKKTAEATRKERTDAAFRLAAEGTETPELMEDFPNKINTHNRMSPVNNLFNQMWVQEDVTEVNRLLTVLLKHLREDLKQQDEHVWAPLDGHLNFLSFYFCFGPSGTVCPNKLSKEAKDALLAYIWDLTEITNDIHFARDDTWLISGSENHDLGHKGSCLLSSMVFMHEEDYKDRIYPNPGTGYKAEKKSPMSPCRKKTIFGEYTPRDQYKAWVEFFEIYFTERAKKGFFLERSAPGYMMWTLSVVLGIYNFVEDAHLKNTVKKFLDLVWTDWAMEQIHGIRGGVKTRHHYSVGEKRTGRMTQFATFLLGGEGIVSGSFKQVELSDYALPEIVWHMILNRDAMGRFTYLSRGIAEENPVMPRPAGVDFTMMANVPQRYVRVSYVTPNYILAMPHEHPRMLYNHLAVGGRWMGLSVGETTRARVVPIALDPGQRLAPQGEKYHTDLVCRGVQYENVQIFQQDRAFQQGGPNMFPVYDDHPNQNMGIFVGDTWDEKLEKEGVLFLRKGKTYVSVRVILIKQDADPLAWAKGTGKFCNEMTMDEEPYTWECEQWLRMKSKFSPVIVEAGEEKDFDGFEEFVQKILNNPPELTPTVVPREAGVVIRYKGLSASAKELMYNSANKDEIPLIDGQIIDYEHPYTFDSPYIKSRYNSGLVEITFRDQKLTLDFNE